MDSRAISAVEQVIQSNLSGIDTALKNNSQSMFEYATLPDVDGKQITTNMIGYAVYAGDHDAFMLMETHARKANLLSEFVKQAYVSHCGEKYNAQGYASICDKYVEEHDAFKADDKRYSGKSNDDFEKFYHELVGGGQLCLPRHVLRRMTRKSEDGKFTWSSTASFLEPLSTPEKSFFHSESYAIAASRPGYHEYLDLDSLLTGKLGVDGAKPKLALGKNAALTRGTGTNAVTVGWLRYGSTREDVSYDKVTIQHLLLIKHKQISTRLDELIKELGMTPESLAECVFEHDRTEIAKLAISNKNIPDAAPASAFSKQLEELLPQFSAHTQIYLKSFNGKTKLADKIEEWGLSDVEKQNFDKLKDPFTKEIMSIPVSIREEIYDVETILSFKTQSDGQFIEPKSGKPFKLSIVGSAEHLLIKVLEKNKSDLNKLEAEHNACIQEVKKQRDAEFAQEFLSAVERGDYKQALTYIKANAHRPELFNQAKNTDGQSVLLTALLNTHANIAAALLAAPGIDVSVKEGEDTYLMIAAERGLTQVVTMLLAISGGKDINLQNKRGHTVVMLAALNNHVETVKALMKSKPTPDLLIQDHHGAMADTMVVKENEVAGYLKAGTRKQFMEVVFDGDLQKLKKYIACHKSEDLNFICDSHYRSPLAYAVLESCTRRANRQKSIAIVTALLEAGADINFGENITSTALHVAAHYNDVEMIEFLKGRAELNVNAKNKEGRSALAEAIRSARVEVVRCLLSDERIDLNVLDNKNETAISTAFSIAARVMGSIRWKLHTRTAS